MTWLIIGLYLVTVGLTFVYIHGNMCVSDLKDFETLYPNKKAWMIENNKVGQSLIVSFLLPVIGIIIYRLGYMPNTWVWTNPFKE